MYRIISTIDGDHVGETLDHIEEGQVVTFPDGDVVTVDQVFVKDEGRKLYASGPHYSMLLELIQE